MNIQFMFCIRHSGHTQYIIPILLSLFSKSESVDLRFFDPNREI